MDDKTIPITAFPSKIDTVLLKEKPTWEITQFGRMLFEQTGECVFIIGMDLRYLAANSQALNLLGYEEDELTGMHVGDVISTGEVPDQQVILEDETNIYERILRRKDGSFIHVEISTSVVSDEDQNPAYIQSIVRDISERKATERILERNGRILSVISEATARLFRSPNIESRISKMLESLGSALDVFCCVIFEIENFSGYPQINIQYHWLEQNAEKFDIKTAIQPFVQRMISDPEVVLSEGSAGKTENIAEYSFAAIPIKGTLGSQGFLGIFDRKNSLSWLLPEFEAVQTATNIIGAALQRIHYEETIRVNEFRNRAIVEAFPDLLIRINSDGLILDYSASPNHPLFIQRDMITGKKLADTWPEDIVNKILGDENISSFSNPHWWEGFQLPFSSSIYESRLQPINSREALIIIRDISDIIRLNEMKTDFINRASHELRTPLTAAILMTDLIQQGGTEEEKQEYWGILKNELNRQKILIDRLLMAGRLESGMLKLESVPLDLIPVLEESMQAVKPIVNKKKIALVLNAPQYPVNILGDNGALQQVFINLINNAAKFSPEGKNITINIGYSKGYVDVSIVDEGMGISPEAIPHLFEKFYRAKNVTAAEIAGSGIGLYIVKSIIEELGGKLDVESEINHGTTLIVHLKPSE
ncbi:MAG TPA: PAS domain-containing sensor histidine kinase [Anaerolineales bacterium]|nr:PAS domain-containing sensor histidine kinase [Anaerolineales bacterium]